MQIEVTDELRDALQKLHPDWNGVDCRLKMCRDLSKEAWIGLSRLKISGKGILPAKVNEDPKDLMLVEKTRTGILLYVQMDKNSPPGSF